MSKEKNIPHEPGVVLAFINGLDVLEKTLNIKNHTLIQGEQNKNKLTSSQVLNTDKERT